MVADFPFHVDLLVSVGFLILLLLFPKIKFGKERQISLVSLHWMGSKNKIGEGCPYYYDEVYCLHPPKTCLGILRQEILKNLEPNEMSEHASHLF